MSEATTPAAPDDGFKWYYSLDNEVWRAATSRDDAITRGRSLYAGYFYICEARTKLYSPLPRAWLVWWFEATRNEETILPSGDVA